MPDSQFKPDETSADYDHNMKAIKRVRDVYGGIDTLRAGGEAYLPMFKSEEKNQEKYNKRLGRTKNINIFGDIIESLTRKPFSDEVMVNKSSGELDDFFGNVNGFDDNLHQYAEDVFEDALLDGVCFILVDYLNGGGETIADEKANGARPLWVKYRAEDVLQVYSQSVNGQEQITEARLREINRDEDGKNIERIRILKHPVGGSPTFEVWKREKKNARNATSDEFTLEVEETALDVEMIPLVPVIVGKRDGKTWRIRPPLLMPPIFKSNSTRT